MVWPHDLGQGGASPDINGIRRESGTRITPTEVNGRRTRCELIRAVPSRGCKP